MTDEQLFDDSRYKAAVSPDDTFDDAVDTHREVSVPDDAGTSDEVDTSEDETSEDVESTSSDEASLDEASLDDELETAEDDVDADEPRDDEVAAHEPEDVAKDDSEDAWFATPDELKSIPGWALPPDLVRDRPIRRKLIPRWVWGATAGVLAGIAIIVAVVLVALSRSEIRVPDVTNTTFVVAKSRLAQAGLSVNIEERRFSSTTADTVLEQDPAAGQTLRRGDTVNLVISAGSEEFSMPDVVGLSITVATGILEGRGLVVRTEPIPSEMPSDTVLLSTPSAGSSVRTGDIVNIQVASTSTSGQHLKPYTLAGTVFVIDPQPLESGAQTDICMDVTRRLRSLLEASGATVVMTRTGTDTGTVDAFTREKITMETSATALIGLDVVSSGAAGRIVYNPVAGQPQMVVDSRQLASAVTSELARVASPAVGKEASSDPVFARAIAPWIRIQVGSLTARPDTQSFADPTWADTVARSIYVGLGEQFALGATAP